MSQAKPTSTPSPPRQDRSRATLDRILVAAEELLGDHLFDAVSMAAIAERAGVSVGVIYTRFPGKEALLPTLFERHDAAVAGRLRGLFAKLSAERTLLGRIRRVVDFAIDYNRRHRGLLRALTVYVRTHPDSVTAHTFSERAAQYRSVAEAVLGDARGVRVPAPLETMELVLSTIHSVCRDELLFGDVAPLRNRRLSVRALRDHLVHMAHAQLTTRPARQ
jgi:AcrR family transcriptional regulator